MRGNERGLGNPARLNLLLIATRTGRDYRLGEPLRVERVARRVAANIVFL
jgi:hypothetical protein